MTFRRGSLFVAAAAVGLLLPGGSVIRENAPHEHAVTKLQAFNTYLSWCKYAVLRLYGMGGIVGRQWTRVFFPSTVLIGPVNEMS